MKKDIHPDNYRAVAFKDVSSGDIFIINSSVATEETIEHEGNTYPLFTVDASSASHPFYTGNRSAVKSAGRVERFNKRFNK